MLMLIQIRSLLLIPTNGQRYGQKGVAGDFLSSYAKSCNEEYPSHSNETLIGYTACWVPALILLDLKIKCNPFAFIDIQLVYTTLKIRFLIEIYNSQTKMMMLNR